MIDLANMSF